MAINACFEGLDPQEVVGLLKNQGVVVEVGYNKSKPTKINALGIHLFVDGELISVRIEPAQTTIQRNPGIGTVPNPSEAVSVLSVDGQFVRFVQVSMRQMVETLQGQGLWAVSAAA